MAGANLSEPVPMTALAVLGLVRLQQIRAQPVGNTAQLCLTMRLGELGRRAGDDLVLKRSIGAGPTAGGPKP